TANEALLLDYMLEEVKDKNEKMYLLNHYIESFRNTVFRQTMFAEFEMIINEHLEKGGTLTAEYLCKIYRELNELYYGPNVVIDLNNNILKSEEDEVEKYLEFIKSGSSDYPINVLQKAGVDMTIKDPVDNAMKLFKELVEELDKLI